MSSNAETTPAPKKRRGWVGALTVVAGALSGLGTNCAARAAAPTELDTVRQEISGLRKDVAGVLDRLRTVELAQAEERGAAAERLRMGRTR